MSFKDGLIGVGFTLGLAAAVSAAGYGACRVKTELQDTRDITQSRIDVAETYGFLWDEARFYWNVSGNARITFDNGRKAIEINGPCGREVLSASYLGVEPLPQRAKEDLDELCEVLDCDGICSEWQRLGGE